MGEKGKPGIARVVNNHSSPHEVLFGPKEKLSTALSGQPIDISPGGTLNLRILDEPGQYTVYGYVDGVSVGEIEVQVSRRSGAGLLKGDGVLLKIRESGEIAFRTV
ncbi:hypothetical protein [Haloarchaeobius sp. HRN-SO-5]|uniref:hypothetical protein n=1 Tax=Haloarchaeobius sp. HRN-SO-5 TaxID=3446118 RepID=UPI003EBBE09B